MPALQISSLRLLAPRAERVAAERPILVACASGGFAGEIAALVTGFVAADRLIFAYPRVQARGLQKRMRARHFIVMRSVSHSRRAGIKVSPRFWLSAVARCVRQVKRLSPKLAVFLGSCEGLPLLLACRLLGIRCVYVESITRVDRLSLTGKIVYHGRLANDFLVQWSDLLPAYPRARYEGMVYDLRYGGSKR